MRRDKRGRKIGRNWWREYNVGIVRDANDAIDSHAEDDHQMEPDEYREAHPYVTLKATLINNRGMEEHHV